MSNKLVVWEWYSDKSWIAYKADVSNFIEQNYPKSGTRLNLGPADSSLNHYDVDVKLKRQVNTETGGKRRVRRTLVSNGARWQYECSDGSWKSYDKRATSELEKANEGGTNCIQLRIGERNTKYTLDLDAMTQTSESSKRERKIKRTSNHSKYIADNGEGVWDEFTTVHDGDVSHLSLSTSEISLGRRKGSTSTTHKRRSVDRSRPNCEYKQMCQALKESLGLEERFFRSRWDRCFCPDCFKGEPFSSLGEPPKKIASPKGWCRLSVHAPARAFALKAFDTWHRAYHGTSKEKVKGILEVGELAPAGRVVLGGSTITEEPGHFTPTRKPDGFDTKQIFVSPSIQYSSVDAYARPSSFTYQKTGRTYKAKVALALLIKPGCYTVGKETIGAGLRRIDDVIDNSEIEWMTKQQGSTILYGLLVKLY